MAPHNKYTVGYCNPYENVAVLSMSMRICKIDGWQDIIQLMISFFMSPGKRKRILYLPDNQPWWKDTTIYYLLDIAIHVGLRVQNMLINGWKDCLRQIANDWARGAQEQKDWDGNKKNYTTMQHNNLRQRDIEVEDKLWRFVYFIHMSSCVDDFIGCRWAVEYRTKVGLDEKMYEMHSLLLSSNISIFILDTLSLNLYNALW